jgi:hypothetical protein
LNLLLSYKTKIKKNHALVDALRKINDILTKHMEHYKGQDFF